MERRLGLFKEMKNMSIATQSDLRARKREAGKQIHLKNVENPTPQKILNYYIQNFETSQNVEQLHAIFNEFRPLKSRIVLYTYDSVLIDVSREETQKIGEIMTKLKYPTRVKTGTNYNNLK